MAEKIFSSEEQQIISRICSELSLTEEQTENIRSIMKIVDRTKDLKNPAEKTKIRIEGMKALTAKFSPDEQVLMGYAINLIWSLIVGSRAQQAMTQMFLKGKSAQFN